MCKLIALFAALVLAALQAFAQTNEPSDPRPIGGVSKAVLPFYKIDFSPAQRELLQGQSVELLFLVNTTGTATLEDIKGTSDSAIRDSLRQAAATMPEFYPSMAGNKKVEALYFLQFELPTYTQARLVQPSLHPLFFIQHAYEDYEYIHKSGKRLDILMGAAANAFAGKPAEYLSPGGGIKMDIMYTGAKGYGGGMVMSIYGNQLKKPYHINSAREQTSAPPTFLLGVGINKILKQQERNELQSQLELTYAGQNIVPKEDTHDEDWVQLQGFSPGLVLHYLIKLGKDKTSFYYTQPAIVNHSLNLHSAVRPLFLNLKEASGVMLELGVSYRFTTHLVDEYRLKQ
ncbi:hypothetical protein [Pontibacter oryzae]|uniref:TonB C-terminal domain-containing protein n=1 Tax=Pontibacter oryzae TaxID=2304593 RepID=A0A399SFK4_9BACT|nr:hypothetical protein [Pontibacter oryzae]RIJ41931.1 hypothetical protein D1627_07970 [Pontibacter oryzae]